MPARSQMIGGHLKGTSRCSLVSRAFPAFPYSLLGSRQALVAGPLALSDFELLWGYLCDRFTACLFDRYRYRRTFTPLFSLHPHSHEHLVHALPTVSVFRRRCPRPITRPAVSEAEEILDVPIAGFCDDLEGNPLPRLGAVLVGCQSHPHRSGRRHLNSHFGAPSDDSVL